MSSFAKLLLLQIRENETVRAEEHSSFAKHGAIAPSQIDIHNVFDTPNFDSSILKGYDGLFIGGASEASVLEPDRYPFVQNIIQLCNDCIAQEIPVFASCFGFQAAVLAFGGEIIRDTHDFEMGTYPLKLTDKASQDSIYFSTPNNFMAVSVHQEKAIETPENCELLAFTDHCVHSFKYIDKPFWAFQFHPELDRECLTKRLEVYSEKYTENREHFQKIIDALKETPESNLLVKHFIEFIDKKKDR